jgi:hypothetical protein
MASFMAAQLPSEDEEDVDFNPANEIDSDEEAAKKKSKKKVAAVKRRRGVGGIGFEDDQDESEDEAEEDGAVTKKSAEDKVKAADVWAALKAGESGKGKAAVTEKTSNKVENVSSIEALCQGIARKKKKEKSNGDTEWMRHLGLGTGQKKKKSSSSSQNASTLSDIAAKALSQVKDANSVAMNASGMITIEETRRFAGKNITVQRDVGKDSKEAKRKQSGNTKKEGLDAVLEQIAPAKKVTVMDKSKSDWKDFKTKDDKVLEELEAHKKSGGTYLEKKDFLAAADVKAYEKERDARLGADVRNRGRL